MAILHVLLPYLSFLIFFLMKICYISIEFKKWSKRFGGMKGDVMMASPPKV